MSDRAPILVAVCGNIDAGDDAFGPSVAHAARQLALPGVEIIDLDIKPTALLDHIEDREALIIVDAAYAPGMPAGQLMDVAWREDLEARLQHDDPLSSHGLSIAGQVALSQRLGVLPEHVRLIAATIDRAELGAPLAASVRPLVQAAAQCIAQWARNWRHGAKQTTAFGGSV